MKKQLATLLLGIGLIGASASLPVYGQADGAGGGGGSANPAGQGGGASGRRGGGAGGMDFNQMRQQREAQMKKDMGATDDEWKVLQPKIEKVQQLRMASFAGGFGGRRGGGGGDQTAQSPVAKASEDLKNTLRSENPTEADIKAKLAALREAKAKAKEEMTKAQEELRAVASVRQEAVLVRDGYLD